jgi:hypothetical protein
VTVGCRALLCCAVVVLTAACGGGPDAPPPPAPPPAVAVATPVAAPVVTTPPVLIGGVAVEDLCAFLAADVPKLRGQAVGSVARLAADLDDFYASQGLLRPAGDVIDAATTKACPDVRILVLFAIGQPNLTSL